MNKKITEASSLTADPGRAERNLQRFFEQNSGTHHIDNYADTALLFGVSQFLANYCIAAPDELYSALNNIDEDITKEFLNERAVKELDAGDSPDIDHMMKALRLFKKRYLLRITLRDITGRADVRTSMNELTCLAETIISIAMKWSLMINCQRYGEPCDSRLSIIGLGKLGGEELNYSSDVDLVALYDIDEGETSGVPGPSGVTMNRISNHEFYCKVMELINKMLSSHTEDGIAYRVDLRLRPQGQRGDIVMPLKAYRTYYESWGRTWERMVLIRARPVAGDEELGRRFIEVIEPFVWKRTVGYDEIEEIRAMKKKIDSTFSRDDIKRGYGGIREAEFFVQTFQLLYAGRNNAMKTYRLYDAVEALRNMQLIPGDEIETIWGNYLYLRRVEHYLQMKEDLQTHTLPSSEEDLDVLSRNMGFSSRGIFLADLQVRRMQIKSMYNSLLGSKEDLHDEALNLLEGGLKDHELTGYLSFRKVRKPERCIASLKKMREFMRLFHTSNERAASRKIIPRLLDDALMSEDPDSAIAGLETLVTTYGIKMAHFSAFNEQPELVKGVMKIFTLSPYLSRIFLSNQYYLDILIEEWRIFKSQSVMQEKLERTVRSSEDILPGLARYKRLEEVRFGMIFLMNVLVIEDLFSGLSHLAEAIIRAVADIHGNGKMSVIALGKLGGREMTFGSDLDIIFVSETPEAADKAVKIIKDLTAYTDMGILYSADTRLRPDGSRGMIANDIEAYKKYYLENAQDWEIQALLKARPVGGDEGAGRRFIEMVIDVVRARGPHITKEAISSMRDRVVTELSQESKGLDVKLGPGGIEAIAFFIQFLQLNHAGESPEVLEQNTPSAISRLAEKGIIENSAKETLMQAYGYYRRLEAFLRLNEERVIVRDSQLAETASKFMGHKSRDEFLEHLEELRKGVIQIIEDSE